MQQDHSYRATDDDDHYHAPQPPLHMHRLPKGHGPAVALPTFVLAQGQYDDLGRSVQDGFNVTVGRGKKEKTSTPGAFDFWKDLELGDKTPLVGSSTTDGSVRSVGSSSMGIKLLARDRQRSTVAATSGSTKLVVPRSEWFIRKALLAKAEKEKQAALEKEKERTTIDLDQPADGPSTLSTPLPPKPLPTKPTPPPSSSLASLLSLPPPGQTAHEPPTHFHIKPNNKGYQLLEKGGWSGVGGLGRPEGWEEVQRVKKEERVGVVKREEGEVGVGPSSSWGTVVTAGKKDEPIDVDAIIDLTGGDEDDDDEADDSPQTSADPTPSRFGEQQLITSHHLSLTAPPALIGPGRVAPIATYLKHDLSGIGHTPHRSYSSLRPAPPGGGQERKKKITHTLADIKAVQRGKVVQGLSEESLELRRRGKAKRDAKREKEDRRKWQQIIAA